MQLVEIFLLALASMVWPALLAVVVVALASTQPVRILSWFLAGALVTTVAIGVAVVQAFEHSNLVSRSRGTLDPVVDLVAGGIALVIAYILWQRGPSTAGPDRPSWATRALSRGPLLAFVVGIVLNVIPGVLPLVALKDIAELDYGVGASVALVVGFYLVMFLPAEIPLASYLVAPAKTTAVVGRFNEWLKRNVRLIGVCVLVVAGIYLVVRGILNAAR